MTDRVRMALSHSRLSDFNQCPRKFKLKYIDKAANMNPKDKDKNIHLVRGQNIHKALEQYVVKRNAGEQGIPASSMKEVEDTKPYIEKLYKEYDQVLPEQQIAVDDQYRQITWFSGDAYWRAIIDILAINPRRAIFGDYKSGKLQDYTGGPTGYGQLHLTALIGLKLAPHVEEVEANYLYVDHRKMIPKIFKQSDLPGLESHFKAEHEKVNSEVNYDPCKNEFCQWCEATKAQCQYSKVMDVSPILFKPKEL